MGQIFRAIYEQSLVHFILKNEIWTLNQKDWAKMSNPRTLVGKRITLATYEDCIDLQKFT